MFNLSTTATSLGQSILDPHKVVAIVRLYSDRFARLSMVPLLSSVPDPRLGPLVSSVPDPQLGPLVSSVSDPQLGPLVRSITDPRLGPLVGNVRGLQLAENPKTRIGPLVYCVPDTQLGLLLPMTQNPTGASCCQKSTYRMHNVI